MVQRNVGAKVLTLSLVLLVCGCGVPVKKSHRYDETEHRIQTIALYPLHYSDDGKEERRFGTFFSEAFFDAVRAMPMIRPLKYIEEDSTVSLMEAKGINITKKSRTVKGATFPVYRQLRPRDLRAISQEAEVLIFCDLLDYSEESAEKQFSLACLSGLLCPGYFAFGLLFPQGNRVRMQITLFETTAGKSIWEYTYLRAPVAELGEHRMMFTQEIIRNFRKYFPLSADSERDDMRQPNNKQLFPSTSWVRGGGTPNQGLNMPCRSHTSCQRRQPHGSPQAGLSDISCPKVLADISDPR